MLNFSRTLPTLAATLALGLAILAPAPAQATPGGLFDQIKANITLPPGGADWAVGQQATHKLTLDMGQGGTVTADLRLALTGKEAEAYWFEWNISNLGGTTGSKFAPSFGGLTLRFLTTPLDEAGLKSLVDDTKTMDAAGMTSPIQKFQYQLAGDKLYEVNFQELATQAAPMAMGMAQTTLPEGQTTLPEPTGEFGFRTGKENVTVPGGTFNNSLFWHADWTDEGSSGNLHVDLHETIPMLPLAKLVANYVSPEEGSYQVKLELISKAVTGAETRTTGEATPQEVSDLFGSIFALILGGGQVQFQ